MLDLSTINIAAKKMRRWHSHALTYFYLYFSASFDKARAKLPVTLDISFEFSFA